MNIEHRLTIRFEYSEPESFMTGVAERQIERLAPEFRRVRVMLVLKLARKRKLPV